MNSPDCTKCGSEMIEGFIADYTYGSSNSSVLQNVWVEGKLESNWMGAKVPDNKKILMTTFRCIECGYLESYAAAAAKEDGEK